MKTYMLGTRDLITWLNRRGFEGLHVHKLRHEDCEGVELIGNVPLHMAYKASRVIKVLMPDMEPIPKGFTLDQMMNTPLLLVEYKVTLTNISD